MKYFVVSDVHGFFKPMKAALNEAGFENGNPEHKLVVCGDLLDRGPQAKEMVAYMRDCPNKFSFAAITKISLRSAVIGRRFGRMIFLMVRQIQFASLLVKTIHLT